jgi:ATP-dependent helicase/nuclease subunit A
VSSRRPATTGEQLDLGFGAEPREVDGVAPPAEPVSRSPDRPPAGAPPSDEQRAVIDFEGDLVVTAGAGSGKTRTLVDLYTRILAEPGLVGAESIGPREILCLTFTERAARELQERIRGGIADHGLLRELETAPVTTFHGWCASLLRDHPLEAGIDPRFAILSEEAADELLHRTTVETLRSRLATDPAARQAVEILGLREASARIAALVRDLRTAGWSRTRPIERFEERLSELERAIAGPLPARIASAAAELLAAARSGPLTAKGREYLPPYEEAVRAWTSDSSPAAEEALRDAAGAPSRTWRFDQATPLRHAVRDAIDSLRAARSEIEHRFQLGVWPALAVSVRDAYRAARAARHALDYDDLLLRSRALLLGDSEVLSGFRRRTRVVLVDEHQDTDPVQHDILRLVVGDETLAGRSRTGGIRWCVVGDSQQSIYGFRGATVEAFERLARAAAERGARRPLATNYRTRPELIDFLNAFFPAVLTGGEREDEIAYLPQRPSRDPRGGPCVELLDPGGPAPSAAEAREIEARALAARIVAACDPDGAESVRVEDRDTGETRTARPGDVVVLLRRLTQVEPYRRALEGVGVESIVVGGSGFYNRQEVYDVLSALQAALLPGDLIALVGFLRSPMVGLPDDAVWALLAGWSHRDGPLLPRLQAMAVAGAGGGSDAGLDEAESAALADGLAVLAELGRRADREPPADVVGWLVDRTGYAAVLDALPDRVQRRANLDRLLTLAERAPSEGAVLLSDWIALLRRRVERPPRERDASLPEAGDRVRVMTIHQSKGLEFPIVALADLGGKVPEGLGGVAFDPDLGVVSKWWEDAGSEGEPTLAYRAAKDAASRRERAEEGRLLYVAATRARERLILSAGAPDHWWLARVREFVASEAGAGLVRASTLEEWLPRYGAALGQSPPLAGPGIAVLEAVPAGPGEATARELAALLAGSAVSAEGSRARAAAEEAMRRGELGHRALERMPLSVSSEAGLATWLAGPGGMADAEARALARYAAKRVLPDLRGAGPVAREHPFRLRVPGGGVVTGTIDVLWRDAAGGWWVGDYKFAEPDPESSGRHEAQLAIYALAASAALGLDEIGGRLWYVDRDARQDLRWSVADLRALESRIDEAFALAPRQQAHAFSEARPALAAV